MFPEDTSWLDKARAGMRIASGAMQGSSREKQGTPPWYESLGKAGEAVGDMYQQHRAKSAMKQDSPLHSAVDSVVSATPATPAGPSPNIGDSPWKRGMDASDSPMDAYGEGRIVTKPTTAIIGDKGPEMVVPLNYRSRAKVLPNMAMQGMPRKRSFYGEV